MSSFLAIPQWQKREIVADQQQLSFSHRSEHDLANSN